MKSKYKIPFKARLAAIDYVRRLKKESVHRYKLIRHLDKLWKRGLSR